MGWNKSQVGLSHKSSMKFEELSPEAFAEIKKLSKKAFRDVGKKVANDVKSKINGRGYLRKGVVAKVELTKDTKYEPCLLIGFKKPSIMRKKVPFYINPAWYENGVNPHFIQTKSLTKSGTSSYFLKDKNGREYGVKVYHTGTKGTKILQSTVQADASKIIDAIKENLKTIDTLKLSKGSTDIEESEEEL